MNQISNDLLDGFSDQLRIFRGQQVIEVGGSKRKGKRFNENMKVGIVVGAFAGLPYIHLQLEARKRLYPEIPMLIHDDSSETRGYLEELCKKYRAEFEFNAPVLPSMKGDLAAFYGGLLWAEEQGVDLLVKFSSRFIPLIRWVDGLQQLARESDHATYSSWTTSFNFGFRTESMGMAVGDWIKVRNQIAVEICSDGQVFVEGFLHNLARFLARDSTVEAMNYERKLGPRPRDKDGYAVWEFIGTDRRTRSSNFLWNDSCPAKDYAKIAEKWGLKYSEDDFKKADLGNGPQPKIEQAPAANGPSAISMPPMGRKAWNLATSLMNFVADGLKTVSTEQYQERLDVCDSCENRSGNRCTKCGCHLSIKAKGRAFDCPIGKWPVIPSS